jgi:SAM-dependent methyltransferase
MKTAPLPSRPCCGVSARQPNTLRALVLRFWYKGLRLAHGIFRILTRRRCLDYDLIRQSVSGACGLEIGGPSLVFCRRLGTIPVYGIAARVDSCDFSENTVWSSKRTTWFVKLMQPSGLRVVSDGSRLAFKSEVYAFVLASEVLEHCANPLKAIAEWKRVLRPRGIMVLSLPHKAKTFDHRRPYTSFAHLEDDFGKDIGETDLTHLDEILDLHDLSLDPAAGSWTEFRQRAQRNAQSRCLHHHVFSPELLIDICTWAGMTVLSVSVERPMRIIVVAAKPPNDTSEAHNGRFLQPDARWRMRDPFRRIPPDASGGRRRFTRAGN